MQVYITRNNQQLGPFEEAKVVEMLAKGELVTTDMAIRHGEQQWQPLSAMYQGIAIANPVMQPTQAASLSRTTVRLNNNTLQTVEGWANANNFTLKSSSGNEKTYQRGIGFLVAPTMLKIRPENQDLVLEIWIRMNLFVRICSLFMLPAEMGIESGGFRAVLPRSMTRNLFNQLLTQLRVSLIG